MNITRDSRVSDVATEAPATIKVFQKHQIDFCCGGKRPIVEVCAEHGIDVDQFVADLRAVTMSAGDDRNWQAAPFPELIAYIQQRFHEPLRDELPRLSAMMTKVLSRHGDHLPEVLRPLESTFVELKDDLLQHMTKEDAILFPEIAALETSPRGSNPAIRQPIAALEAEHDQAGRALARMRELTSDYMPPEWACPTFRGLYDGLAELEREMHVHVHLENNILYPRAASMAATT